MAPMILETRHPVESGGYVLVVSFNRPKQMNAMSVGSMADVIPRLEAIAKDPDVRAVVLTGEGKAFSAGADLSAAMAIFQGTASPTSREMNVVAALERLPMPVIGAINGPAITGGFEVALACDIRIASPTAVFADTHAKFGIHPCWGLSQKLQRLIGVARAMHYSLSALPINAEQAEKWGLVSQVVPANELVDTAVALAKRIAGNSKSLVNKYKKLIHDGGSLSLGEARTLEEDRANVYYKSMTPETFQAMAAFLSKKKKPKARL